MKYLAILLVITGFYASAQENYTDAPPKKHHFGITFMPAVSGGGFKDAVRVGNEFEYMGSGFGFDIGPSWMVELNKHTRFIASASLSRMIYKQVQPSNEKTVFDSVTAQIKPMLINNYLCSWGVTVPAWFEYSVFSEDFEIYLIGGAFFHTFFSKKVVGIVQYPDDPGEYSYEVKNDFSDFNFGIYTGVGTSFEVGDNTKLYISPTFKFFLNTQEMMESKVRYFNFGINSGLFF